MLPRGIRGRCRCRGKDKLVVKVVSLLSVNLDDPSLDRKGCESNLYSHEVPYHGKPG